MLENIERITSYVAGMDRDEFQRDGRTREPDKQAIKTVLDLRGKYAVKPKLARSTAEDDFGSDPLDPLTPEQEKEQD